MCVMKYYSATKKKVPICGTLYIELSWGYARKKCVRRRKINTILSHQMILFNKGI